MSKYIDDGLSTTIGFSLNANVKFQEVEVTPPGIEGGGGIPTTTMRNTVVRTKSPKKLYDISDTMATCRYDPTVYSQIVAMINKVQQITITHPDMTTHSFYGWLDEFKPGAFKEGDRPLATIKIISANRDTTGAETGLVVTTGP